MGLAKAGAVVGEGKAVTSYRSRSGEDCGEPGSIDPEARETELEGSREANVRRFRLQCSVPCMPVVSKAGNRVTWNHFLLAGAFASDYSDY